MRPSGVCATSRFSKSLPMKPAEWTPSVSTMPGLMALTRIFLRPNSLGQKTGHGIHGALGRGIDDGFGGGMLLTTEPMLMTLPPSGPKCVAASWVARIRPSTLVLNCRWNSSSVTSPSGENS